MTGRAAVPTLKRCLLIFGLAGPLIGYSVVCVLTAGLALLVFFIAVPLAYAIGGPPAALTGLAYWAVRRAGLDAAGALGLAVVFGAVASIAVVPLFNAMGGAGWNFGMGWLTGVVGGAAAGICAWSTERRTPQTPRPFNLANFD